MSFAPNLLPQVTEADVAAALKLVDFALHHRELDEEDRRLEEEKRRVEAEREERRKREEEEEQRRNGLQGEGQGNGGSGVRLGEDVAQGDADMVEADAGG